ncbi:MAG: hypothetical protein KGI47_06790 [Betaproteobacteria bacterium]|nr:hypothetical protein [Betaproteobacteria bacterium]MDE2623101.1 hypothetical protein [Betaproteobacteria bacterium]
MNRSLILLAALAVVGAALLWWTRQPEPLPGGRGVPSAALPSPSPAIFQGEASPARVSAEVAASDPMIPQAVQQDPFRAFLNNHGKPVVVNPSPLPPGTDPFREALLRKPQEPVSGVSPFGSPRP